MTETPAYHGWSVSAVHSLVMDAGFTPGHLPPIRPAILVKLMQRTAEEHRDVAVFDFAQVAHRQSISSLASLLDAIKSVAEISWRRVQQDFRTLTRQGECVRSHKERIRRNTGSRIRCR